MVPMDEVQEKPAFHKNDDQINELTKLLKKEQDAPNAGTSERAKDLKKRIGTLKGERTRDRKKNDD